MVHNVIFASAVVMAIGISQAQGNDVTSSLRGQQNAENRELTFDFRINYIVGENCDPSNSRVAGNICKPNTATIIAADPCSPNDPDIGGRGWYCQRNTGNVIISKSQEQAMDNGKSVIEATVPTNQKNKQVPYAVIPYDRSETCVLCDPKNPKVAGKWCKPRTADLCESPCDPCDEKHPDLQGRGWFCKRNTAQVCVNEFGTALVDGTKFATHNPATKSINVTLPARAFGGALTKNSCRDSGICIGLSIAGAIAAVALTAGGVAFALAPAATVATVDITAAALIESELEITLSKEELYVLSYFK